MKNIILLIMILTLNGCGDSSTQKSKKKDERKNLNIEGSVSRVLNLFVETSYAAECNGIDDDCDGVDDDCDLVADDRLYDKLSCFPKEFSECEGREGERCVFLLDEHFSPMATGAVIGGRYSFNIKIDQDKNDFLIMKVEDYSNKEFYREHIFELGEEEDDDLNIDPETTLTFEMKKNFLNKKRNGEEKEKTRQDLLDEISEVIRKIKEEVGDRLEEMANKTKNNGFLGKELKRLAKGAMVQLKDLFDILVSYEEINLQSKGNEELVELSKSLRDDIRQLNNEIEEILNTIAIMTLEFEENKRQVETEVETFKQEYGQVQSNRERLQSDNELLDSLKEKVLLENIDYLEKLDRAKAIIDDLNGLIRRSSVDGLMIEALEENLSDIDLEEELNELRIYMKRKFAEQELNDREAELAKLDPDLVPDTLDLESIESLRQALEIRVNRIDMARQANDSDLIEVNARLARLPSLIEALEEELRLLIRAYENEKSELEEEIQNKRDIIARKDEIRKTISLILLKRNQGHLVGEGPILNYYPITKEPSIGEFHAYAFKNLEISSEENSMRVVIKKGDETLDVILAKSVKVKSRSSQSSVIIVPEVGDEVLLYRKRPDLLTQEWDMIIDDDVTLLMENPLHLEDRSMSSENPLYQGGTIGGENPMYEESISGGFRINFKALDPEDLTIDEREN